MYSVGNYCNNNTGIVIPKVFKVDMEGFKDYIIKSNKNLDDIDGDCLNKEWNAFGKFKNVYGFSKGSKKYVVFMVESFKKRGQLIYLKNLYNELSFQCRIQTYFPKLVPKLESVLLINREINTDSFVDVQVIMDDINEGDYKSLKSLKVKNDDKSKYIEDYIDKLKLKNNSNVVDKIKNLDSNKGMVKLMFYLHESGDKYNTMIDLYKSIGCSDVIGKVEIFSRYLFNINLCGVIHCDLNNDNIFYRESDKSYKFIDFGLSIDLFSHISESEINKIYNILKDWKNKPDDEKLYVGEVFTRFEDGRLSANFIDECVGCVKMTSSNLIFGIREYYNKYQKVDENIKSTINDINRLTKKDIEKRNKALLQDNLPKNKFLRDQAIDKIKSSGKLKRPLSENDKSFDLQRYEKYLLMLNGIKDSINEECIKEIALWDEVEKLRDYISYGFGKEIYMNEILGIKSIPNDIIGLWKSYSTL